MEYWIFELVRSENFSLNWQFWVFLTKFTLESNFQSKTEQAAQDYKRLLFV